MPDEITGTMPVPEQTSQTAMSETASATDNETMTTVPSTNGTSHTDDPMEAAMKSDTAEASLDDQMPPLDEIDVPVDFGGGRAGRGGNRFASSSHDLKSGDVVTGTVVKIDGEGVLVDVGMKTEGLIRLGELSREPVTNIEDIVKVGDKVDVLVMEPEGKDGHLLLSKKRADFEKAWDRVQEALADGRTVQAMVTDRVRGGLVVDLGIRGFVPASHVGNGKLRSLDKFMGQSVALKVLEVDREHRKVVLSHRLATEEEREQQKKDTIGALAEGQTRTGTVRRVTEYGAFIDLGGIDGLLHVSEMSWTRIKHPSDIVKVGDQVDVMILRLSLDQGRVSLGMRQILPDPWLQIGEKYHVGDTIEGEVTRIVPFGVFILLEGGIEGIIPNSELSHRRIARPGDVVEQGQMLQVKVIDVRPEERRLTLSLKALQPREPVDEYRPPRMPRPGGNNAPIDPNLPQIVPPPAEDGGRPARSSGGGGGGRERKRGGRGSEGDEGGGGGDYRSFMTSRDEPRITLGDMFRDALAGSGRGGGKATGKAGGKRRRDDMEEDDDLSDLDTFEDVETPEVDAEAVDAVAEDEPKK